MRNLTKIDQVLKIQIIHSKETGIHQLKESMDLILSIESQIHIIRSLKLSLYTKGLTKKQKGLFKGTLNELRTKFKYLDKSTKKKYYDKNQVINLKGMITEQT